MTDLGVRVERLYCPISTCPWTHDDPGPGTGADVRLPAAALSAKPGTFADAMAEATYRALLAHALGQENVIREHLATHSFEEWVREIMRLRENKPPATVYEVAVWEYEGPDQRILFGNQGAAEAYKTLLPGSDLDEIPVLDQAPTRVTVHYYETWVLPDGVTMSPRPPRLRHAQQERWSHNLWPAAAEWTHPGSHTHIVRPTTEPVVCVLETYGFDQRATWQAHLDEEARLRKAASDG